MGSPSEYVEDSVRDRASHLRLQADRTRRRAEELQDDADSARQRVRDLEAEATAWELLLEAAARGSEVAVREPDGEAPSPPSRPCCGGHE